LIIAILLAIAIPTFLGVSGSARDRSAQSNVTNATTDAIAYYQNAQTFDASSGATGANIGLNTTCSNNTGAANCGTAGTGPTTLAASATQLGTQEPAFSWNNAATACTSTAKCVSVGVYDVLTSGDGQAVIIAGLSGNSNNCWFAANLQQGTTGSAVAVIANTGFDQAASGAGSETGATTAGTYYAELANAGTTKCMASEPSAYSSAWTWYSSYTAAAASGTP